MVKIQTSLLCNTRRDIYVSKGWNSCFLRFPAQTLFMWNCHASLKAKRVGEPFQHQSTINKDFTTGFCSPPENSLQKVLLCHGTDNMKQPHNWTIVIALFLIRGGRQNSYWQAQTNGRGFTGAHSSRFLTEDGTDWTLQAGSPRQPSAFSWIYLILQHSEVM